MKKTMVLLLLVVAFMSCKKDDVPELKKENSEELKIANRGGAANPPDYQTMQNVNLYVTRKSINYNIRFDWEAVNSTGLYATNFQTSISLNENFNTGFQHTWTQVDAVWGIDKKNHDVMIIFITAVDNFWVPTRTGGMNNVKTDVTIQVKYNVKTQIDITTVTSSEIMYVK